MNLDDKADDYTVSIDAANPTAPCNKWDEDRWNRNIMARQMIDNRHSKAALIDLTHWLLTRAERAEAALSLIDTTISAHLEEDDQPDTVVSSQTGLKGSIAREVIEFVRNFQTIARMGLGITFQKAKAA